jgi:hypothetical protein
MEPMARRTSLLTRVALVAVPLALLAAACGSGGDDEPTDTTEAPTTTLPVMPTDFSWWDPSPTPIGAGWVLERCTDDLLPATVRSTIVPDKPRPVLCFDHPDGRHGILKIFRFLAPEDGDLNAQAARFVDDFVADRRQGCGENYLVKADPIVPLELPDGTARRYGFTGGATGSPTTEHTVQWAGIRGPALVIVTISVYDPGSCIVPDGEATLDDLDEVQPGIEALISASGLPGEPPK